MGILNVTPDSFYSSSRTFTSDAISQRAETLVKEGADIIDIGGYSSRPGADDVNVDEELRRVEAGIEAVRRISPNIPVSVDTFRARVAELAITGMGANIINDISGGLLDNDMLDVAVKTRAPYIMMHMRGTPATMQQHTSYNNVTAEVIQWFSKRIAEFSLAGVNDIIVDPGIGFSKSLEGNFELIENLSMFKILERPVLVGVSRKSMIYKTLETDPESSLNGTTILNTLALERGASILRVHDVKEASEVVKLLGLIDKV
ncbi:MAG: dihydropteroate synthase [Muribaculaceae bacterium]|nr:dihydropteroate synthase [Muribaculaceae bacterium]